MSAPHPPSATGVVFSTALLPENVEKDKAQATATVKAVSGSDSSKGSPTPSIHDAEKAESNLEDDDKALGHYLVPALAKGQKNARLKPPTYWTRFSVWYNYYRVVRSRLLHYEEPYINVLTYGRTSLSPSV